MSLHINKTFKGYIFINDNTKTIQFLLILIIVLLKNNIA